MRLFIAINFNNDTVDGLMSLRETLRKKSTRGNFTHRENMHLTLAFLGECDRNQISVVKSAMDSVSFEPINICIVRPGRFQRPGGDIWWAGLEEDERLLKLQRNLTDRLTAEGFVFDRRKYSPHITLGREVVTEAAPWKINPFGETSSGIDLMKSERVDGKLTYTSIYGKCAK